jgi:hypothetical protein
MQEHVIAKRAARFTRIGLVWPIVVFLLLTPAVLSAGNLPILGVLESIDTNGIATGWAIDPDTLSVSIDVHFYVDGPAGAGGVLAGIIRASIPRLDIASTGAHGFRFSIPTKYRDGRAHTLFVYGIDSSGAAGGNLLLSSAPLGFTLNSSVIYLTNGVVRVGLEPRCGGTLVELSLQGRNPINNFDCTGRQIQAAIYDGNHAYDACAGCTNVWGWNPVQGGDRYNFGSPVQTVSTEGTSAYIATRPYEWHPDNKGGGPGRPVLSDVTVEQWASFVPGAPHAIRLHYRVTHGGSDTHANAGQEFPAVFANVDYDRFVHYAGTAPWTQAAVTSGTLPTRDQPNLPRHAGEHWSAIVDDAGFGITVYVPGQYPYASGMWWPDSGPQRPDGGAYFRPIVPFTFAGPAVLEGDVYVIVGDYRDARDAIYALHQSSPGHDFLPPLGLIDTPTSGRDLSGTSMVTGWAFDDTQVAAVDVLVDGALAGRAEYGLARPDVAGTFPHAPTAVGFSYALDTRRFANGTHRVTVRATDHLGHVALLRDAAVQFTNTAADTTPPTVVIQSATVKKNELSVTAAADDNVGVSRVELWIDGRLARIDSSAPYAFRLNLKSYGAGSHQLIAKAFDAAGNVGTSSPVWVTVQ